MTGPEPPPERLGRLAFAYCKIATVALICGHYALPVAGSLSAVFFLTAWIRGKRDTRCYLRSPLLAAAWWTVIVALWVGCEFARPAMPGWLTWINR